MRHFRCLLIAGACSKIVLSEKLVPDPNLLHRISDAEDSDEVSYTPAMKINYLGFATPTEEMREVQLFMDGFFGFLKTFIDSEGFHFNEFSSKVDFLERNLDHIRKWTNTLRSDLGVADQVNFTTIAFKRMARSALYLKELSASDSRGFRHIFDLVQLNVCMLGMYTAQGNIDLDILEYADVVHGFRKRLSVMEAKYGTLSVPVDLQLLYDAEVSQAESTVGDLEKQLPKKKIG